MDHSQTILILSGAGLDVAALELALAHHQYRVVTVGRDDRALELAAAGDVALVLVDTALAGNDGFTLVARLASAAPPRRLPVLLMSSHPSQEEQQRAAQAGADGYFTLPLSTSSVLDHVLLALHGQRIGGEELEVNYRMMMAGSPDAILLIDGATGLPIDVNTRAETMFGRSAPELLTIPLARLCTPLQPSGLPSAEALAAIAARVRTGEVRIHAMRFQHSSGRRVDCEMRMIRIEKEGRELFHLRLVDVTGAQRAEALRIGQNRMLEMMARGAPLQATLEALVDLIEAQSIGVLCSVMLLDEDGKHMRYACGPSLPPAYRALIDGMAIGPGVGSCGTAMFRRESVVVSDIDHDPLWAPYLDLIREYGLKACWSTPIMQDDTVLGSFAMYYRTPRYPEPEERRLISVASHLASIAIERARGEAELERHRAHLEELVAARSAELAATQEELVRRDKLAALGALVAGVAHELGTPIGNSLTTVSAMSEHTAKLAASLEHTLRRSDLERYVAQAREADALLQRNLQRAAILLRNFRQTVVDTRDAQRRHFVLDEFLGELLKPLWAGLPQPRPQLVLDVEPGLHLDSYPGPLTQALGHLIDNCVVHAFNGEEDATITIRGSAADDGVLVSVRDNGAGIAPQHLRRVFDPFFTTRLGAGQSGLGLYIAHNIVTGALGGHLDVHSEPGAGTTFTMRLPAIAPT